MLRILVKKAKYDILYKAKLFSELCYKHAKFGGQYVK